MAVRHSRLLRAAAVTGSSAMVAVTMALPAEAQVMSIQPQTTVAASTPSWATGAHRIGGVDGSRVRHIQVALALRDRAGAQALARAVSTPGSPQHKHFLSSSQFSARFAPTQDAVAEVENWLRSQGMTVTGASSNRHTIDAVAPNSTIQRAFATTLSTYRQAGKDLVAPSTPVSVPASLQGLVTGVLGLDDGQATATPHHVARPADRVWAAAAQSCSQYWAQANNADVPQKYPSGAQSNALCGYSSSQLRAMYGLGAGDNGAGSIGIVGAYSLSTAEADVNAEASRTGAPPWKAGQLQVVLPDGGIVDDPACQHNGAAEWAGEESLDLETSHAIAPDAGIQYYAAKNCLGLTDAVNTAVAQDKADVLSLSWGTPGEQLVSSADRAAFDDIAVQAAIQG